MKTVRHAFFALFLLAAALPSCGKQEGLTLKIQSQPPALAISSSFSAYVGSCIPFRVVRRDVALAETFAGTETSGLASLFNDEACSDAHDTAHPLSFASGESLKLLYVKGLSAGTGTLSVSSATLGAMHAFEVKTSAPSGTDPGFHP